MNRDASNLYKQYPYDSWLMPEKTVLDSVRLLNYASLLTTPSAKTCLICRCSSRTAERSSSSPSVTQNVNMCHSMSQQQASIDFLWTNDTLKHSGCFFDRVSGCFWMFLDLQSKVLSCPKLDLPSPFRCAVLWQRTVFWLCPLSMSIPCPSWSPHSQLFPDDNLEQLGISSQQLPQGWTANAASCWIPPGDDGSVLTNGCKRTAWWIFTDTFNQF